MQWAFSSPSPIEHRQGQAGQISLGLRQITLKLSHHLWGSDLSMTYNHANHIHVHVYKDFVPVFHIAILVSTTFVWLQLTITYVFKLNQTLWSLIWTHWAVNLQQLMPPKVRWRMTCDMGQTLTFADRSWSESSRICWQNEFDGFGGMALATYGGLRFSACTTAVKLKHVRTASEAPVLGRPLAAPAKLLTQLAMRLREEMSFVEMSRVYLSTTQLYN